MTPDAAAGYAFGHLLGGAALALSFALLYQRRTAALIWLYATQACVLAAAAAWHGWTDGEPALFVTAAVTLAAKGILIPAGLRRISHHLAMRRGVEPALGIFPSMALGVGLVALAILTVLPVTPEAAALTREDLALALSVALLGMLMMITRRFALAQVIGFMSFENGLILAAVGVPGMPLVVELSVAVLVLVAFAVFGVFMLRIGGAFGTLDTTHLDRVLHRREAGDGT